MHRSLAPCLLAASALLACEGLVKVHDDTATQTSGGRETSGPPTTGDVVDASTSGPEGDDEAGSTTWIGECPFIDVEVRTPIPRVMLVLDKSGSMSASPSGYWDHDGDDADDDGVVDGDANDTPATPKITRWKSLHATIAGFVDDFAARMALGAVLFPALEATQEYSAKACPVHATPDVAIGADQGVAILAAIPPADAVDLHGGTPATAGVLTGIAGLGAADESPRYLVLVTDGAANCPVDPIGPDPASLFEVYDDHLPVVVADALAADIPTFVVGIAIADTVSSTAKDGNPDATNTFERLNAVAVAGGMARPGPEKFYNTTNQVELHDALQQISASITSCTLEFAAPPPAALDLDKVEVDPFGPNPLVYGDTQVQDCATQSGWRYTDANHTGIELCGEACALYRDSGDVDIRFDCLAD